MKQLTAISAALTTDEDSEEMAEGEAEAKTNDEDLEEALDSELN